MFKQVASAQQPRLNKSYMKKLQKELSASQLPFKDQTDVCSLKFGIEEVILEYLTFSCWTSALNGQLCFLGT